MSANKEAVRLCEKIVRQAFGDVVTVRTGSSLDLPQTDELLHSESLRRF